MTKLFHLTIAKVGETLYDGAAQSVTLPGEEGMFTVLANHEPLVTPLKAGTITLTTETGKQEVITVSRYGVAEVSEGQATVLV